MAFFCHQHNTAWSFLLLRQHKPLVDLLLSQLRPHSKGKLLPATSTRNTSSSIPSTNIVNERRKDGPTGDLFVTSTNEAADETSRTINAAEIRVGNLASIRRTFGPNDNAQALLLCGGSSLARHASFDPTYARARTWIRSHAIGPAVVEPILIQGLVAALIEAAFPQRVPLSQQMTYHRPLIVGVETEATVTVAQIERNTSTIDTASNDESVARIPGDGVQVTLRAECKRVRDDTCVAEGTHQIWIPDT
jgi:hypothetical protein